MKILSPYYLVLAILLISFVSCEDNYQIEDEETFLSDPNEVEASSITGSVINLQGEKVTNAVIVYSHNDDLHSTNADANGDYLIELPKDDSRVFLQAHADEYLSSGIDIVHLAEDDAEKNIDY
jgi:hypothetical protein